MAGYEYNDSEIGDAGAGEWTVDAATGIWSFVPYTQFDGSGIPIGTDTSGADLTEDDVNRLFPDEECNGACGGCAECDPVVLDPDGHSFLIKTLVTKLDKAIEIGDRLAIAVIETTLGFGYADRFQREF